MEIQNFQGCVPCSLFHIELGNSFSPEIILHLKLISRRIEKKNSKHITAVLISSP